MIVLKHAEEEQCTSMPVYLSSDYITNIYISFINQTILHISTVLIYFYPRMQSIASFLTFFSLYHMNMKSKEKFPVDCHCKVNMFGCDIFYRISYLLLTVQICFVKMIKSMYYHLIDFVVFKKCYHIFLINFLRTSLQNDKLNCAFF